MSQKLFGCQPVLLTPDKELGAILEFICSEANKLTNCGIYYARQLYFKAKQWIGSVAIMCIAFDSLFDKRYGKMEACIRMGK